MLAVFVVYTYFLSTLVHVSILVFCPFWPCLSNECALFIKDRLTGTYQLTFFKGHDFRVYKDMKIGSEIP